MILGPYPYADSPVGGVESAVHGLVSGLAGHEDIAEVHVVDFRRHVKSQVSERPDASVYVHRMPAQRHLRLLNGADLDFMRLRSLVGEIRPDVVHGQGIGTNGLHAVNLGIPSVVTVHGIVAKEAAYTGTTLANRLRVHVLDRMAERIAQRAGCIVSLSEYDQRALPQLKAARCHVVIPNAVALSASDVECGDELRVLYAGMMSPIKNVVGIVQAFSRVREALPSARLQLAGPIANQSYVSQIRQAERAHCSGAVDWLGALDRDGMQKTLAASSCLVLFSHQENLPMIIAEAMMCGIPVVASEVGGVGEMVVSGKTGFTVPDGDEGALADALITVLSSGNLRSSLGSAGRQCAAELYSVQSVADRTVAVYRRAICRV
jgi:glycosyltransferase involved in cell wall biosynthesis